MFAEFVRSTRNFALDCVGDDSRYGLFEEMQSVEAILLVVNVRFTLDGVLKITDFDASRC